MQYWKKIFFALAIIGMTIGCGRTKKGTAIVQNTPTDSTTTDTTAAVIISTKNIGLAYLEENKLREAEKQFKKLISMAPQDASGYANLGVVFLRQGNNDDAEKMLKKAKQLAPDDPDIRLNLAKVYELKNKRQAAMDELQQNEQIAPEHVKTLYSIAEKYEGAHDDASLAQWEKYMRKIVQRSPKNIVARLYLIEALIQNGKSDEALKNLEEAESIYPQFPSESTLYFDQAVTALQNKKTNEAITPLLVFHNFLKLTPAYQAGIRELKGPQNATVGVPVISMDKNTPLELMEGESILEVMHFSEATAGAGLADLLPASDIKKQAVLSVGDMDGDGDEDVYYSVEDGANKPTIFLLESDFGRYRDIANSAGIAHSESDRNATFVDVDNDGFLDLFINNEKSDVLYSNISRGHFQRIGQKTGLAGHGNKSIFFDLDHEGDLDMVRLQNGQNSMLINHGDGTFTAGASSPDLLRDTYRSSDGAFADFDNDGDIDLAIANTDGPLQLFLNQRQGRLTDETKSSGISGRQNIRVFAADFNNDGLADIFSVAANRVSLWMNDGKGRFTSSSENNSLNHLAGQRRLTSCAILDFDNDGLLDIFLSGRSKEDSTSSGALLLHNSSGHFEDVSYLFPEDFPAVQQVEVADYNQDGDPDLFVIDLHGNLRLYRNDGGNANHHLKIKLVGLRTGSGKNNYFGIGARVEVRAGSLYQSRLVTRPTMLFGMGNHTKADVVRIMWTNGVPQNIFSPGSDKDLIETQELKGSCPFLYAWNGERFVFVKDMMWRSALGMPLGIMGGKKAYAFADASVEYLKIPGELLQPKDGAYTLQMTEELWETIYADQVRLLAVDHPAGTQIFVNEKFEAPPYSPLRIYTVREQHTPIAATDTHGNNLRDLIAAKDHRYISNFSREKYQGITEMKDLILDLGQVSDPHNIYLFLNGWIFPTDASINVALSQAGDLALQHPSLEVINQHGKWQKVIDNIGFPSGKNKTVIVDLSDKFLSDDHRIRIRTNMEIYWDHIFFARDEGTTPTITPLPPAAADHHYRGFSAMHRLDGRYGPHWFDYDQVTTGQKWRDLTGNYTRYGDVTDLLQAADDRYIIADAGDETTLHFDAKKLPKIHDGYTRDFLIYSVGWVKDGDLNTALGQTVAPLPFHGMSRYPYGPGEHYPDDPAHRAYQQQYNTRQVNTGQYKNFVRKEYH